MKNLSFTLATPEEIGLELGARIKAQRLAQALRRVELAARADVHPLTVANLENRGSATVETLLRVTQALGLAAELESLFLVKVRSIEQMEQAEAPARQRAPRRRRG
jgi:transcriptional regulator with XRE-family HTH domain